MRQTQQYCMGNFSAWDPKITTFPGLYLLGVGWGHLWYAAQRVLGVRGPAAELCSVLSLRALNVFLSLTCLPVFYYMAQALDRHRTHNELLLMVRAYFLWNACQPCIHEGPPLHALLACCPSTPMVDRGISSLLAMQASACFFFPLHFFYTFMYYTDIASVLFTLSAHLLVLQQRYMLSAAWAAAAILMRQTNSVWVAYSLGMAVLQLCMPDLDARLTRGGADGSSTASKGHTDVPSLDGSVSSNVTALLALVRRAWLLRWQLLRRLWGLIAVVAAFAAFVVWNGGIVVGDKSHHAPVLHLMQPLYFALYASAWLAPVFWTLQKLRTARQHLGRQFTQQPARALAGMLAGGAAVAATVHSSTLVHPFLLADNRHYTFYLWRRVLGRTPWARYIAVPAYLCALAMLQRGLAYRHPLFQLLFAGATCMVLVPAHLVEFRYFTTPFLLLVALLPTPSSRQLGCVVALFAAVDALTLCVYLLRPYAWVDGTLARFMW